jgi:predicted DNA-binding protein
LKWVSAAIDDELFRKFSIKCAQIGKKKAEVIRELIEQWVSQ